MKILCKIYMMKASLKIIKTTKLFLLLLLGLTTQTLAQNTELQYLSGKGADDTVAWDFYCSDGMNSKKWTSIQVPSCWEQQSFGAYNYGHVPFENRLKETGLYKRNFIVPLDWKNKEIKIVFEGVMTDATVKINGQLAGPTHQGAFYEFDYDITALLHFGEENEIEVLVKKFSDNESINYAERKADFWIFGGIFRPVYLEARPKENIQRVAINAKADGSFLADIFTSTNKNIDQIQVQVQSLQGETIATFSSEANDSITQVSGQLDNPKRWNPETPNMYQAVFTLLSNETILHQHLEKFGFRTVEVKESDGIYVNGVKIKFKGVNRHTFHPDYGRTSSKSLSIEAVKLMKEMNMNAVRMSHYVPDRHFLDVCDSLGLFVLDELTGWQKPAYDEQIGRKLLGEMIKRDVNHPSIVLWDNGNEGGWNTALDDDFSRLDIQKRTVIHPWEDFGATNTFHYVDYNYLSLDGYAQRKIFFPTELLHGLYDGGHGAGLEDYWLRIWHHPLAAGAFLWVFADEGIARTDRNGEIDLDGNHAPDGILGPYMEKEASFYTIKKVWSPVYLEKRYINAQFDGSFQIENRYHYTDLEECQFISEWFKYEDDKSISSFKENLKVQLASGQKGQLKVQLPDNWQDNHVLEITALDKDGLEINRWSYAVQKAEKIANLFIAKKEISEVKLTENDSVYQISVGQVSYAFNKQNGQLSHIQRGNETIPLSNGPIFISRKKEVDHIAISQGEDGAVELITVFKENADSIIWTIQADRLLDLQIAYEPVSMSPQAGVTFSFPEDQVQSMKWLGQGPYRVWKNRAQDSNFGLWEKQSNTSITGHSGFEYPEFKGYHSDVYWAEIETDNSLGFKVYIKSDDIFLRMLTPGQSEDGRTTIVDFPAGNISFMHGIDAIGTKFKDKSVLGPQSSNYVFRAKNIHLRKLRMHLIFDFE